MILFVVFFKDPGIVDAPSVQNASGALSVDVVGASGHVTVIDIRFSVCVLILLVSAMSLRTP